MDILGNFLEMHFKINSLSLIVFALAAYIGLCVSSFASRAMQGDSRYVAFMCKLLLLIVSIILMISTDNLIFLLMAYGIGNILLVSMMIHKSTWKAARVSGMIAAKNYAISIFFMSAAFFIFYSITGSVSISALLQQSWPVIPLSIALTFLLIACMMQSAIWPFHGWLLSSLNSPTPVSAMMHAGLINGGGILLVRFAPLYLQNSTLLIIIFCIGLFTALLGTFYKLMQSDVKRMLACSTVGQMGFMFMQCGLGLFPAAVAHLVWHGMFKAYLFLASGSAAQEKRFERQASPSLLNFVGALLLGFLGSLSFAYASGKSWLAGDSSLILMIVSFIATTQFALTFSHNNPFKHFVIAGLSTILAGFFYGASVGLITWLLGPLGLMQTQPLNGFYIIGMFVLILGWLMMLFTRFNAQSPAPWMLRIYVKALNASQPHPESITAHRNHYRF